MAGGLLGWSNPESQEGKGGWIALEKDQDWGCNLTCCPMECHTLGLAWAREPGTLRLEWRPGERAWFWAEGCWQHLISTLFLQPDSTASKLARGHDGARPAWLH